MASNVQAGQEYPGSRVGTEFGDSGSRGGFGRGTGTTRYGRSMRNPAPGAAGTLKPGGRCVPTGIGGGIAGGFGAGLGHGKRLRAGPAGCGGPSTSRSVRAVSTGCGIDPAEGGRNLPRRPRHRAAAAFLPTRQILPVNCCRVGTATHPCPKLLKRRMILDE